MEPNYFSFFQFSHWHTKPPLVKLSAPPSIQGPIALYSNSVHFFNMLDRYDKFTSARVGRGVKCGEDNDIIG